MIKYGINPQKDALEDGSAAMQSKKKSEKRKRKQDNEENSTIVKTKGKKGSIQ
jgi:hypothetical protein